MSPKKTTTILLVLLAVSLSANAFLGGQMLARKGAFPPPPFMHGREDGPPDGDRRMGRGMAFLKELPPEVAKPFAEGFSEKREHIKEEMDAMRAMRGELMDAVKAEPFDRAKVEAMLDAQRDHQKAVQMEVHDVLLDGMEKLTPEQRALMVEKLSRQLFR